MSMRRYLSGKVRVVLILNFEHKYKYVSIGRLMRKNIRISIEEKYELIKIYMVYFGIVDKRNSRCLFFPYLENRISFDPFILRSHLFP